MLALATSHPALTALPDRRQHLHLHTVQDEARAEVERFIHSVYRERYGARVQHYAPMLVSLRNADHEIIAAAGYRIADAAPLFLERYLSQPVEALLASDATPRVARARIVEVGHLSASQAGAGKRLIHLMGPHLASLGLDWVVSTLTQELQHLFVRLGITPLALGVADPALLGAAAADWGSYYDHRPVVVAGRIDLALRMLDRRRSAA
ncbi:MAG: thermostable hemolysin [Hylemonella sp.]|uniref:thermostable hemolysin n=1 Tax=Hylemonella sp. TaxID=2066020 RepID=UPI0022CAA589|nr:thermostable hemolysin [Hylemonella sp.]MCZ8252259.1 thermostable hemolysin [Hylemonella sp.]